MLLNVLGTPPLCRNVIILSASSYASLHRKLEEYACMFGHDTILGNAPHVGSFERWQSYSAEIQGNHFLRWAADASNNCIILLDELDDVKTAYDILNDIPSDARIVVSTRNPAVSKHLQSRFRCFDLSVSELDVEDAVILIETAFNLDHIPIARNQTERLVMALDRHPFTLCSALAYLPSLRRVHDPSEGSIVERFLDILEGPDPESRKEFFDFQGLWGVSVFNLFDSAMNHLMGLVSEPPLIESVRSLLQAIAFVSDARHDCSFVQFFHAVKRSTRNVSLTGDTFNAIFDKGLVHENHTLEKAIQSSLILETPDKMYMPPIWRDCIILYECKTSERRKHWLEQVLLLCHRHFKENDSSQKLRPYAENCVRIAARYDISLQTLFTQPDQQIWLEDILHRKSDITVFEELLKECQEAVTAYRQRPSEGNAAYVRLDRKFTDLKEKHSVSPPEAALQKVRTAIQDMLTIIARASGNAVYNISLSSTPSE